MLTPGRYASLAAQSSVLDARAMSDRLGFEPDRAWSVGDVWERRGSTRTRHFSFCRVRSRTPESAPLDDHLVDLLDRVAPGLARYTPHPDIEVTLVIVQYLSSEDSQPPGFGVDAPLLELLSRAHASIVVDQYVLRD